MAKLDLTPIQENKLDLTPIQETTPQSMGNWLMSNVAKPAGAAIPDILSGLASGTRDLGNGIGSLLNYPLNKLGAPQIPQIPPTMNLTQAAGLPQNPGLQEMASFAPTAIGSEFAAPMSAIKSLAPLMAKMGTEGATFQATQTPDNPLAIAGSGALNALIPGAQAGAQKALIAGAEHYGLPGFANKAVGSIKDLVGLSNKDALKKAEANYGKELGNENQLWTNLDSHALIADSNPTIQAKGLDTSSYKNALQKKIDEYEKLSKAHTGFENKYAEPVNILKRYKDDQIGSFESAFNQNKALNSDYRSSMRPTGGVPKSQDELKATSFAIKELHNMIDKNMKNYGLEGTLGKSWVDAKKTTQDINQIFRTVPDAGGNPKTSLFSQNQASTNPFSDPTSFISNYVPRGKGEGTQSMQQFVQMMGDEQAAKNHLKANVFEKVLEGGKPDAAAFINKLNTLSGAQKHFLFNPQELEQINLVKKLADNHGDSPIVKKSLSKILYGGASAIGAGAGAGAAHLAGVSPVAGAFAGATLPALDYAGHALANKPGVNNFLQKLLLERMRNPNAPIASNMSVAPTRALTAQQPLQGVLSNGNY